jgi:subtilase family serine protease
MLIMTEDRAVTATFERVPSYALSVTKTGTGSGRVSSDVPGIDCGTSCSVAYIQNTRVVLTAVPDAGVAFTGWSGACTGTGACTLDMTAARAVTATFSRLADLRVSALSAPATVRTGQTLVVASTVTNGGGVAAGAFTVTFYLSPTDAAPGAGVVIGTRTLTTLEAGASAPATTPITIPLGFDPGTYFLSAVADTGGAVVEIDETNNGRTAAAPVTVLMYRADLRVMALTAAATVRTGQSLGVMHSVKNTGQAAAPPFRVTFYLSATDATPGAGIAVGSRPLTGLAAGASSVATTPLLIPRGFDPGTYFLSAVVDDPNGVIEVDDTNNGMTATTQVTVLMYRPDLTVTALSAPPTGRTGQPLAVTSTVKNVGQAAAPAFRVTFYLSPSSGTPGAGMAVGSRMLGGLAAGAASMVTTPVLIPLGLDPGAYFLSALADDNGVVIEVDETNNGLTASSQVTVLMFRPDLTVAGLAAPATVRTGQSLSVLSNVRNIGQRAAPAFRVTFYLSATDSTPGAGLAVGSRTISGLAADASITTTTPVTVPLGLPPGAYFLSAVADDNGVVLEADETNNGRTAADMVTVVMYRADLMVSAVGAPVTGRTGQPLPVMHTIRNVGQTAAPSFRVTFYLSAADSTPGAGRALGSRTLSGLGAGMNASATAPMMVPPDLEPGTYFLSAVVDGAGSVIEVDEGNNGLTATEPVTILMHRPDLTVTALTSPATGQTSRPLAVTSTVTNVGQAAAAAFRVTFYLSATDPTPGAGLAIGSRTVTGLPAGGVSTVTAPVTIPATGLAAGTYFLSAVAALAVPAPEVDATNNGFTSSTPVAVALYRPDLTITNLTAPSGDAVTGRPVEVAATVRNTGPAPAGAFRVTFYLSTNGTLEPGDAVLGSQSVGGLAPNASVTTTVRPVIPMTLAPNFYYVIAIVDDAEKVTELVESDNVRAMPSAMSVVPLMVRTYRVNLTLTTTACNDPSLDGTDTGPVTLRIPTQIGGFFSGTFGFFSGSVDGVTLVTTFSFSGTVNTAGAVNGSFSVDTVGGGFTYLHGQGFFLGSITGTMLSAELNGFINIVGGYSCTLVASVTSLP